MVDTSALSTRVAAAILALMLALSTALVLVPEAQAKPRPGDSPISTDISAPAVSKATGEEAGTFEGTFDVRRFKERGDTLYADGWVTGFVVREDGTTTREVTRSVSLPVQDATTGGEAGTLQTQQACDILTLQLGPLDLDLLGLVVQLDQVNLDIIAEPGQGNLLGNLLCAVAGLLDPGGPEQLLGIVEDLLNAVLDLLEGL